MPPVENPPVTVTGQRTIALSGPDITDAEVDAVTRVLRSGQLSLGPQLAAFEEALAAYVGTRYAVGVNSGTSALHLCVRALGWREPDEVITTPFSFVASANCLLYERVRPVFVDIDPVTFNLDPNHIEHVRSSRTRGILPVHVFGQPCDMTALQRIASRYGWTILEDACEAIGAEVDGRKVGSFGRAGTFAFYPNKQITTGEGGAVTTDDPRLAELARSMSNQGRGPEGGWYEHVRIGYNYRLDELSAALGVVQLNRIEEILSRREAVAAMYEQGLAEMPGVQTPPRAPGTVRSWFVYVVTLDDGIDREAVMTRLREQGVACRAYFAPIHLQDFYRQRFGYKPGAFPVTESVAARTLALPFHNHLTQADVRTVCDVLQDAVG